jgi:hypothetical protein
MPSRFLCTLYQILIYRLKITLLAPSADGIRATLLNFGGHIVLYSASLNIDIVNNIIFFFTPVMLKIEREKYYVQYN